MSDNILKKGNVITLINNNERIPGIIKSVLVDRGKENKGDSELNWMDKHFERNLFVNTPTYQEVNNRRYKALKKGDRVLVLYYDEEDDIPEVLPGNFNENENTKFTLSPKEGYVLFEDYINKIYNKKNEGDWYKGTIKDKDGKGNMIIIYDDDDNIKPKKHIIDGDFIRKMDDVYDTLRVSVITDRNEIILDNFRRGGNEHDSDKIYGVDSQKNEYKILLNNNPTEKEKLNIRKKRIDNITLNKKNKTKYKLNWFYKTNYSGSKYFPLKISNVQQLSEASKYSQVDRYTKIKEGDIIKYNDPSHPNNGLLAKIIRIKNDDRDRRSYYDKKRYIYNIKFEPLETYIDPTELKDYQQRYENMIMTIDNVSERKILKFRYVEKTIYDKKTDVLLLNKNKELDNFNSIIVDNTLQKLKKNTQFIPDYVLAKYQPESNIRDMTKLIKPNKKNVYMISHSPNIKKRESGLFFDMKIDEEKNEVEIDIYVDLLLFQSKMVTQEEWDNKPLAGKIGSILSEQIKNSYAGVFNCPNRFDKIRTIVNNLLDGKIYVDSDDSETNLIKKSFRQTSIKIKEKKEQIKNLELDKKAKIKEINDNKNTPSLLAEFQTDLGKKENEIKKAKRELIELEGIMKQKGGKKTKRRKRNRGRKRKTKKYKR